MFAPQVPAPKPTPKRMEEERFVSKNERLGKTHYGMVTKRVTDLGN
jgi:hypothetical protein